MFEILEHLPYPAADKVSKVNSDKFSKVKSLSTGLHSTVGNVSGYRCLSDCNPGVASLIPTLSHTFMEIDHEIISMAILLPSTESFKKCCCQLPGKVCARSTG